MNKCNGCNRCVNYKSEATINKNVEPWGTDTTTTCKIGNTTQMLEWWENNGTKMVGDKLDDMPCFQQTEFAKRLENMSSILDEIKVSIINEGGKSAKI